MVHVTYPEPPGEGSTQVLSKAEIAANLGIRSVRLHFISSVDHTQGFIACRTPQCVSLLMVTGEDAPRMSASGCVRSTGAQKDDISISEDAVEAARFLADVPVLSLMDPDMMEGYQAQLAMCVASIGNNQEDSRIVLAHLLQVAGRILNSNASASSSTAYSASIAHWCDKIKELSYTWTTFQLLRSSSTPNTGAIDKTLQQKWHMFQSTPILEMMEDYVKLGSMRAVAALWSRHLSEKMVHSITNLLQYLPATLPVSAYADWIQNEVIPVLIQHVDQLSLSQSSTSMVESDNGSLLAELALWILKRSEAAATKGDLEAAIRLSTIFSSDIGKSGVSRVGYSFHEFRLQTSTNCTTHVADECDEEATCQLDVLVRLDLLKQKLHHIQHLATEHNFLISLSVFEDETPATIAMSMLDRVPTPELLRDEVKTHVRKYLIFCGVSIDPVLRDYITELAESIQASESAVEVRALALLDEISDVNIRAETALTLFRSALPPYSLRLKQYANDCAKTWCTEHLEEIQEHVRLMEIQDMLMIYGVTQFDIADAKSASRLLGHVLSQISSPTSFLDAMCLVDAYSNLSCDRAAVQFTENLLSFPCGTADIMSETAARTSMAMVALEELKKRKEVKVHLMLFVSLLEEIIQFGVTLLEMEATGMEATYTNHCNKSLVIRDELKAPSFVLRILETIAIAYLKELKTLQKLAVAAQNEVVGIYTTSNTYLLSNTLLTDLQRIRTVEEDFNILLPLSVVRDPGRCETKLKQLMNADILFADDNSDDDAVPLAVQPVPSKSKGKRKKRAAVGSGDTSSVFPSKKHCNLNRKDEHLPTQGASRDTQQDDARARLIFDLNRFASVIGIDYKTCQSLIAQRAAQNGSILEAVRFCRGLYSRRFMRGGCSFTRSNKPRAQHGSKHIRCAFNPAEALKSIAKALSFYTATHVEESYDLPRVYNQRLTSAQTARMRAPFYSLELLKYSVCECNVASFDETLGLLKNAVLVNDVLELTQFDLSRKGTIQRLYPRWFRGDTCVLPSHKAMKFASRFAIAEHKNLGQERDGSDIASKRYVSFLVEHQADVMSLQILLSMQVLPDDAVAVVHTQLGKILSSVFQSQEIDNYLALGLMLSMEQVDSFHAFRKQISRENVAKDYNRFQQLALVGADAARAWEQIAFLHQCVELEGNARWWHYLNLLGIECNQKAFQSECRDLEYIRRLVPTLISRSNYDLYTVLEFTRHYQIDDSFPALVYAEALLLQKSATDNLEYQDKIAAVIDDIHDGHLVTMLLKSVPKVSGMDYDRLLFIFQLLLDNTSYPEREEIERRVEVLHTLKAFAVLQTKEVTQASSTTCSQITVRGVHLAKVFEQPDAPCTDMVDQTRISFHELMSKPLQVLARLLEKTNFTVLIGLSEPLRLDPDELYILLLKNMVNRELQHNRLDREGGNSGLTRFNVFEGILKCFSDTERRVSAAECLAEKFSFCEEKLKALEFAQSTLSRENGSNDPCNTSFTGHEASVRLEAKILRLKVELILQKPTPQKSSSVEMFDDKQRDHLLSFVSTPKKLFFELYRTYALQFYSQGCETLHVVAASIAELLQLPRMDLWFELVREWLVADAVHIRRSSTATEEKEDPFTLLDDEKLLQKDDDYIKRILYLATASVKHGEASGEEMLSYLIMFAEEVRPRAGVTYRAKMRALRVILRLGQLHRAITERYAAAKYGIADADAIFRELLNYTRHCAHMVVFEEHRVPYDIASVLKSDKEALTRNLLRRFSLDIPWVLRCASQLMLDFGVEAADIWEAVLSNMKQLQMVRSLANIMGPLSRKVFVRSLECGKQLWEDVLVQPVVELKRNHASRLKASDASKQEGHASPADNLCFAGLKVSDVRPVLERMVSLLERCPFLDQIDVPAFVVHLRDLTALAEEQSDGDAIVQQLRLHDLAVKCAMTIPKPQTRFEALARIIRAGAYRSVLQALLDTSCFLNGEQSETTMEIETGNHVDNFRLIQEVFSVAAKRNDYAGILGTSFEQGFVEYLAATSNIDYLLSLVGRKTDGSSIEYSRAVL